VVARVLLLIIGLNSLGRRPVLSEPGAMGHLFTAPAAHPRSRLLNAPSSSLSC